MLSLAVAELAIGRRGGGDAPASMARLAATAGRTQRWGWVGGLAIATGFVVLSYYAVIGDLTLAYLGHAVLRRFAGADATATRALFAATGRDTPLGLVAVLTVLGDTAISLLAGMAVLPLVFAQRLDPAEGAGLMFLTLPIGLGQFPLGHAVGAAFFLSLFAAAIASSIAMLELAVAPVIRWTGWSRRSATAVVTLACWAAGLPSALSFNLWQAARPLAAVPGFEDASILDVIDRLASNLMLPVSGLLLAVFAGRVVGPELLRAELGWRDRFIRALRLLLRWVVPALILAFLVFGHLPA